MAIEIAKKSKLKGPLWLYILLIAGVVLVLGLGGSYLYFYLTSKSINQEIDELSQQIKKTPEEKELEDNILAKEKKIEDFKKLLAQHKKVLSVFSFLQEKTHPEVWLSDFDFKPDEAIVSVSAKSENFESVGQQIMTLREEDILKKINLSDLSTSEKGGVVFSLKLEFDPQIFEE